MARSEDMIEQYLGRQARLRRHGVDHNWFLECAGTWQRWGPARTLYHLQHPPSIWSPGSHGKLATQLACRAASAEPSPRWRFCRTVDCGWYTGKHSPRELFWKRPCCRPELSQRDDAMVLWNPDLATGLWRAPMKLRPRRSSQNK